MYAFSFEVPGTESMYEQVKASVGEPPEGQLLLLVSRTAGGLRHLGVWRSRAEWEHYRDATIRPAVAALLAKIGIPEPPAPVEQEVAVVDLQQPGRG
ncbi:MAG TPA: hypothetical protein VFW71_15995 [Actinomycetota bacterium]|nr:hypothetical protein [Actinomycetota bacterium]